MEFLRGFIKEGYIKAIGKMEEYKIILGASAYFDKGILKEEDLKEIYVAINNAEEIVEDNSSIEEITEEIVEENNEESEE